MRAALLCLLLAGCASAPWLKPGHEDEFAVDSGQCQVQALSGPAGIGKQAIYNACMQGKGWTH